MSKASVEARRAASGGFKLALGSGVATALSVASLAFAARALPLADMASVLTALSLAKVGTDLVDFGGSRYLTIELSAGRLERRHLASCTRARLTVVLLLTVLSGFLISHPFIPSVTGWTISYIALRSLIVFVQSYLYARRQFVRLAFVAMSEKAVALSLVTLSFSLGTLTSSFVMIAYVAGALVALLSLAFFVPLGILDGGISLTFIPGASFGLAALAGSSIAFDVSIVHVFGGGIEAALYSLPTRVIAPVSLVAVAFSSSLLTILANADPLKPRHAIATLLRGSLVPLSLAMGLCLVLVSFSRTWIVLLGGEKYADGYVVLRIAAASAVFVCMNILLLSYFQALGQSKFAAGAMGVSVVLALSGVGLGAEMGGAVGAAIGYLVGNVALSGMFAWRIVRGMQIESRVRKVAS